MKYLADTNILSQQDTDPKIRAWVMRNFLTIGISTLTVAEIAQGIEALPAGKRRKELEQDLADIMQDYTCYPFGLEEAREWGRYVEKAGRPLPVIDSLLAATALANNLQLVTRNPKDFPGVPVVIP